MQAVLKRLAEISSNAKELQKYHSDEWIMREALASMALSREAAQPAYANRWADSPERKNMRQFIIEVLDTAKNITPESAFNILTFAFRGEVVSVQESLPAQRAVAASSQATNVKEYGCLQEIGLGAICSSANNFLCENCTEKLIRRVEELEPAQQQHTPSVCHVCKGEGVVSVNGNLRTCTWC